MLAQSQIVRDLKQQVMPKIKAPKTGPVYYSLWESFPLIKITSKSHYQVAFEVLIKLQEYLQNHLITANHRKEILKYLDLLADLIADYEKQTSEALKTSITGAEMLAYLMEEHSLKQSDLKKELGAQSIASEILNGKRKLNLRQVKALAKRFHVSPASFL